VAGGGSRVFLLFFLDDFRRRATGPTAKMVYFRRRDGSGGPSPRLRKLIWAAWKNLVSSSDVHCSAGAAQMLAVSNAVVIIAKHSSSCRSHRLIQTEQAVSYGSWSLQCCAMAAQGNGKEGR
jgi:hypothetical protein